jgi:hypothetical protein
MTFQINFVGELFAAHPTTMQQMFMVNLGHMTVQLVNSGEGADTKLALQDISAQAQVRLFMSSKTFVVGESLAAAGTHESLDSQMSRLMCPDIRRVPCTVVAVPTVVHFPAVHPRGWLCWGVRVAHSHRAFPLPNKT